MRTAHVALPVSVFVLGLICFGCGKDQPLSSVQEQTGMARQSKPAGMTSPVHQAVVMATVTQGGEPVEEAEVAFSRSISGQALDYKWKGTTDADGQVKIEIAAVDPQFRRVGASGYYVVRAIDPVSDAVIGKWGSIPINDGKEVALSLPTGEPASIEKESPLEEEPPTSPETLTETLPGASVTMAFVYIKPGKFMMGSLDSLPGYVSDEEPEHEVTITKGFYMGKYEVTQSQWTAVMGTTPWADTIYVQENPDHPAVYISWNDAREFIQKLNQAAGSGISVAGSVQEGVESEYAVPASRAFSTNKYGWHPYLFVWMCSYIQGERRV